VWKAVSAARQRSCALRSVPGDARRGGPDAIVAVALFTGSSAIGLGPVFWLLISEFHPVRIRGTAMSMAMMANWGATFVVTISFLTLLNATKDSGTFFLFAALTVGALVYCSKRVPETKGLSLQEIERQLT
jgi:hypothetical protein